MKIGPATCVIFSRKSVSGDFLSIIERRAEKGRKAYRTSHRCDHKEKAAEDGGKREYTAGSRQSNRQRSQPGAQGVACIMKKKKKKSEVNARNNGRADNFLSLFFFLRGKTESRYLPIGRRESSSLKSMYFASDKRQLRDAHSAREPDLSFDINHGNGNLPRNACTTSGIELNMHGRRKNLARSRVGGCLEQRF